MTTSEQIGELAAALAQAQGEMEGAKKDAANPYFKSKYADLASVREACMPSLNKHGIAVLQSPTTEPLADGGVFVSVETRMLHSSGQWMSGIVSAAAKDGSPQAVGSCITYLRRYSLQSFASVAPEDDDGEAAQGRSREPLRMAKAVIVPAGYEAWWAAFQPLALEGLAKLTEAWKAAPAAYRQHLETTDPKARENLKTVAAQADAAAKPVTPVKTVVLR
jgi:ERF superfamily protein